MKMELEATVDQLVVDGASRAVGGYDDWVDLFVMTVRVRDGLGVSDEDLRRSTMAVIEYVLSNGLMVVGDFVDDMTNFVPWGISISDALARIDGEWNALGRDPRLWEICWFENTAAGNERAQRSGLITTEK
ncbi:hypothetical protein [Chondromyces crocatus]|nr:hypothetical protein [Chondromyces crocatus]